MNKLNIHDLNFCIRRLPSCLIDVMKNPSGQNAVFVAGGFIRSIIIGEPVADIDVFVKDKQAAETVATILQYSALHGQKNYRTQNAITVKTSIPIQIIHRWTFNAPEDVAQSFDFTICATSSGYQESPQTANLSGTAIVIQTIIRTWHQNVLCTEAPKEKKSREDQCYGY